MPLRSLHEEESLLRELHEEKSLFSIFVFFLKLPNFALPSLFTGGGGTGGTGVTHQI